MIVYVYHVIIYVCNIYFDVRCLNGFLYIYLKREEEIHIHIS